MKKAIITFIILFSASTALTITQNNTTDSWFYIITFTLYSLMVVGASYFFYSEDERAIVSEYNIHSIDHSLSYHKHKSDYHRQRDNMLETASSIYKKICNSQYHFVCISVFVLSILVLSIWGEKEESGYFITKNFYGQFVSSGAFFFVLSFINFSQHFISKEHYPVTPKEDIQLKLNNRIQEYERKKAKTEEKDHWKLDDPLDSTIADLKEDYAISLFHLAEKHQNPIDCFALVFSLGFIVFPYHGFRNRPDVTIITASITYAVVSFAVWIVSNAA